MPSVWIIHRAWPVADLSSLPPVVRAAIDADDSFLGFYYILGSHHQSEYSGAGPIEYWTLCWDSNNDVDQEYYQPQHTRGEHYAFVRMDHVGPLPIASNWHCSWEKVRGYIDNSILETALDLHNWSVNVRQLRGIRRRRSDSIAANMQKIIERSTWLQCYWCDVWVQNAVIIDWTGGPLCNSCYGRYVDGVGPYEQSALQRIERQVYCVSRMWSASLCQEIASFLHTWHEP